MLNLFILTPGAGFHRAPSRVTWHFAALVLWGDIASMKSFLLIFIALLGSKSATDGHFGCQPEAAHVPGVLAASQTGLLRTWEDAARTGVHEGTGDTGHVHRKCLLDDLSKCYFLL